MTKDVISLSILVLLLFRHYISHKITFGAPSSGGVLCSACCAFMLSLCVLETFFVNKSLFASIKWIFNILDLFLCEHQL